MSEDIKIKNKPGPKPKQLGVSETTAARPKQRVSMHAEANASVPGEAKHPSLPFRWCADMGQGKR